MLITRKKPLCKKTFIKISLRITFKILSYFLLKIHLPISRAFFNYSLNNFLFNYSNKRHLQTAYTTHSFRHDFITQLWKDSNDIEYVRQFMGHKRIESTVAYIKNMSDAEKTVKLLDIDIAKRQKQNRI